MLWPKIDNGLASVWRLQSEFLAVQVGGADLANEFNRVSVLSVTSPSQDILSDTTVKTRRAELRSTDLEVTAIHEDPFIIPKRISKLSKQRNNWTWQFLRSTIVPVRNVYGHLQ